MEAMRREAVQQAMVRLADGDRNAIDVLVAELWPVLRAFAARALHGHADADDVAQESFFKVCARIHDFDRRRDGVAWAFGIAGFEVRTQRKKTQRRREVSDAPLRAEAAGGPSPEAMLETKELEEALAQALGALTEADREALLESAADAPSPAARRKRKQRALERLRDLWRRLDGND